MADVINTRDLLLQNGDARVLQMPLPSNIVLTSLKGVQLRASATMFRIDEDGTIAPASIFIFATPTGITGVFEWSVVPSGGAVLTGSGHTQMSESRTLTFENMSADFVTIRATMFAEGVLWSDELSVIKVRSSGRASVKLIADGTSWADAVADSAVQAHTGDSEKVHGDQVTIRDAFGGSGFALTKWWNTTSDLWTILADVIDTGQLVKEAVNDCYSDSHATNLTLTRGSIAVPANASALVVRASPGWSFDNGAGTGIDGTGTLASYMPNYCFIDITVSAVTTRYYGTEVVLPNPAAGTYSVTATRVKVGTGALVSHFGMSTTVVKR